MRLILIILLISFTSICSGQSSGEKTIEIRTVDKQTFVGKLVNITADSITIKNETLGIITLSKSNVDILYNGFLGQIRNNSSEPYFVPTAIPNGRGNHYYRNYALFGQNFSFGLNDQLDVSIGFEVLSLFVSDNTGFPVMQLAAKYSGEVADKFHVGLSTKVLFNGEGGGILTSVPFTFGGPRSNFTISPTYSQEIGDDNRAYITMFNFNIALSEKIRIVTDGLYTDGSLFGTSLVEIKLKSDILLQPGIIFSDEFSIVPNFSFTIPIGSSKNKKS